MEQNGGRAEAPHGAAALSSERCSSCVGCSGDSDCLRLWSAGPGRFLRIRRFWLWIGEPHAHEPLL